MLRTGCGVCGATTSVGTDTVLRRTVDWGPSCRHVEAIVLDSVESSISSCPGPGASIQVRPWMMLERNVAIVPGATCTAGCVDPVASVPPISRFSNVESD